MWAATAAAATVYLAREKKRAAHNRDGHVYLALRARSSIGTTFLIMMLSEAEQEHAWSAGSKRVAYTVYRSRFDRWGAFL